MIQPTNLQPWAWAGPKRSACAAPVINRLQAVATPDQFAFLMQQCKPSWVLLASK